MRDSHVFFERIHNLYKPYNSTLLSFSGGVDSTVAFFLLCQLRTIRKDFILEVFYLNHQMPGNEEYANRAAQWTAEICEKYGVHYHIRTVEPNIYKTTRLSQEEQGRVSRYGTIKAIMEERQLESVTTGHHQDDLVETVLMRLFQGVSPARLNAIQEVQDDKVRPLLTVPKSYLLTMANEYGWPYLEDPSNACLNYKRNRLRLELIPKIREQFPVFDQKIIEFLLQLEAQNKEWERLLPTWSYQEEKAMIERAMLEEISPFCRKESLRRTIKYLDPSHYLTYRQLDFLSHYIANHKACYEGEKILYNKGGILLKKKRMYYICERKVGKKFVRF